MTFAELIVLSIIIAAIMVLLAAFLNKKRIPNISSDSDVLELLHHGERISAIKAYRQLHGAGLKEAKEFIERHSTDKEK